MILSGRYALVTGGGTGLGKAIARHLVQSGASVMICGRNAGPLEAVTKDISVDLAPGQEIFARGADISKTDDVNALVSETLSVFPHLDILVNNAGVYGPMGTIEDNDWAQWVAAININLLGTIYLTRALVPHFKEREFGKIINLSGGGATQPLPGLSSYAVSKAGLVRFVETLARETENFGIDANAIAPGVLNTRMLDEAIEAGPDKVGEAFHARMVKMKAEGTTASLDISAELVVFLSSDESNGISGRLISSLWDPWREFPKHLGAIKETDIYTLRRIIPKERDMDWGDV